MHRRAKLTVLGRRLLVHRVIELGWPVVRAAEAQGVSAATGYKWVRRWRTEGEAGLADRSSRPHHSPGRLSPAREQAILACRTGCRLGPHRIGYHLGEARSTVGRVLVRHGVARLADLDRPTATLVRYQRARPGELLHVDVKKLGRIPDGGGHRIHGRASSTVRGRGLGYDYLHVAVDDRTRLAYVEPLGDETGRTAAGFLGRALGWFAGLDISVERVLTDNAKAWTSTAFQQVLADAKVRHRRTRPYRPQTNGKVERFNRTLLGEWAYQRSYASNSDRLATLPGWVHAYNHHRAHTALEGLAPMQILNNLSGNYT
jgi:transposase InsO family protein